MHMSQFERDTGSKEFDSEMIRAESRNVANGCARSTKKDIQKLPRNQTTYRTSDEPQESGRATILKSYYILLRRQKGRS